MGMAPPAEAQGINLPILVVGDSKSLGVADPSYDFRPRLGQLGPYWLPDALLAAQGAYFATANLGRSGFTTTNAEAEVDAFVAASQFTPTWILYNLGRNDNLSEADWKAKTGYVLDALHTKWPAALVKVTKPWWRGSINPPLVAAWIDSVVSTRAAWASVGDNENVWMENGDDGVTYTYDGTHQNAVGAQEMAAQKRTAMGY